MDSTQAFLLSKDRAEGIKLSEIARSLLRKGGGSHWILPIMIQKFPVLPIPRKPLLPHFP